MTITGYITRLVPGELGAPDRIFFRPDPHLDLRNLDGKHRAGDGELMAEGGLEGRTLNARITAVLSSEDDPNLTTLRALGRHGL